MTVADVHRPITFMWPERDDNPIPLWLVPGDWTRGRAVAYVASEEGVPFTSLRARRAWMRWEHLRFDIAGWQREDGTLAPCSKTDLHAEAYWEVTVASDNAG